MQELTLFVFTLADGKVVKQWAYDSWEATCLVAARYKHSPVASWQRLTGRAA